MMGVQVLPQRVGGPTFLLRPTISDEKTRLPPPRQPQPQLPRQPLRQPQQPPRQPLRQPQKEENPIHLLLTLGDEHDTQMTFDLDRLLLSGDRSKVYTEQEKTEDIDKEFLHLVIKENPIKIGFCYVRHFSTRQLFPDFS